MKSLWKLYENEKEKFGDGDRAMHEIIKYSI